MGGDQTSLGFRSSFFSTGGLGFRGWGLGFRVQGLGLGFHDGILKTDKEEAG